ncbi:hypothetical protein [Flavobacterium sp.]|jgi:hypothetical protein|uniref:hypothetical protein n=1 Tax=Flavobacterium sp. TaxID=239 RepID=UPI002A814604|nr:hypothetical protein [Flavobacterium sp.]
MTNTTIFLIILSVVIAGLLSFYQYIYKVKNRSKVTLFLAFLRFISIFTILLLLINPIISRKINEIEKIPLLIIVDNSSSIDELENANKVTELHNAILKDKGLNEKFSVQSYTFDEGLKSSESPDFKGKQTRIDNIAKDLKQLYRNKKYPVVLLTDGNQTHGNDYVYAFPENISVNPMIIGDTTTVIDLKVSQINVNKYAFLKNKFPIEVFLQYNGNQEVESMFSIMQGNQVVYKEKVRFAKDKRSITVDVLLPATRVGIQKYTAIILPLSTEKNKTNNSKFFAVEILDQRSEIALITDIIHPDISALKRSIEVNEQRKVKVLKVNEVKELDKYNLFVIYQPNSKFLTAFNHIEKSKSNCFIITGKHTDFNFLNGMQDDFDFKSTNQSENYSATFNGSFTNFSQENIGFDNFSPLENKFVSVVPKNKIETLLFARIRNVTLETPLLSFTEVNKQRFAYLFGENLWKWRSETYLAKNDFKDFDLFIDKTIQYLVSNDTKKSLVISHGNFYNTGESISIKAQYFNKNYEFDEDARLEINLVNTATKKALKYNFSKTNNGFEVVFNDLIAGNYTFLVKETRSNTTYTGGFEVLDFNSEKQFVNPNKDQLVQLANNTNGIAYYPDQIKTLIDALANDDQYKPIAKEITQKSPLIDLKWLLVLLAISLATEWFIRKYNGLV